MLSETHIQQHLVKLLQAFGRLDICWFAIPNGELRTKKTAARLKTLGLMPGASDLFFVIDGKPIGLELKRDEGKQSNSQTQWQECLERAGGRYVIAWGLSEAIAALYDIGAFVPGVKINSEARAPA